MEFASDKIPFPSKKEEFPRNLTREVLFTKNVLRATVILTGSEFGFSPNQDRRLGRVVFNVAIISPFTPPSPKVTVQATLGVRDWSGDVDDEYEGIVYFTVIAETA